MYRVEVDWAEAYELAVSLHAYAATREHKTLEIGEKWVKDVRTRISPAFAAELAAYRELPLVKKLEVLVWQCPGERDATSFVRWLGGLSPGALYELVAPYTSPESMALLRDLGAQRDQLAHLLQAWDERYFHTANRAILDGLAADATAKRALLTVMAPDALAEAATGGVYLAPIADVDVVVLVPQYHYRPWNLYSLHGRVRLNLYPADALPTPPGEPSPDLLRLTRALADESRLRILRFLATTPRGFTDVVHDSGLAKSTVHHHLVALRAAGLVRVHDAGNGPVTYSLRPRALDELGERLGSYLAHESNVERRTSKEKPMDR